jgi:histidinol-phosphate aminotransferase
MSPTPVTMASPIAPTAYTWEATAERVSARYGVPIDRIVRFDLNTSPAPPPFVGPLLAAGRFHTSLSEYPPSDYRRLVAAAAARYRVAEDEILVGAGADEILDLLAKTFLPAGAAAVIPTPSYAMFRVLTEQRAARVVSVPRLGAAAGFALDLPATRDAAREAAIVWLCSPNNPTALAEPAGAIEELLAGLAADAATDRRPPPIVALDEAYAEFTGTTLLGLREAYPRLVVVRTASKAYGLAGLRVGFAISTRPVIAEMEPYRPPGSVSTVSVTVVTHALEDDRWLSERVPQVDAERDRLTDALRDAGWSPLPSVTNFLLVPFGTPAIAAAVAEGLLSDGLVPRTFGAGHPLADHLRLTVRLPDEDDRLIRAARRLTAGLAAEGITTERITTTGGTR